MKKVKWDATSLIKDVLLLIIGILLILKITDITYAALVVMGVAIALKGILMIVKYFRSNIEDELPKNDLANGIVWATFGICCVILSKWIISAFPAQPMIYIFIFFILFVSKLQKTVNMIRIKQNFWFMPMICAIISLAHIILLIINPFEVVGELWRFVGVSLILDAAVDALAYLFVQKLSD